MDMILSFQKALYKNIFCKQKITDRKKIPHSWKEKENWGLINAAVLTVGGENADWIYWSRLRPENKNWLLAQHCSEWRNRTGRKNILWSGPVAAHWATPSADYTVSVVITYCCHFMEDAVQFYYMCPQHLSWCLAYDRYSDIYWINECYLFKY